MAGTLSPALVLVELLGLSRTLFLAAAVNVAIAISAGILGWKFPRPARATPPREEVHRQEPTISLGGARLIAVVLFPPASPPWRWGRPRPPHSPPSLPPHSTL